MVSLAATRAQYYTLVYTDPRRQTPPARVPLRVTQVLQDSMEGSAKVAMFVNVAPTAESAGESVCSLNFAARVRGVELGAAGQHSGGAPGASDKKARPATARPGR